MPALQEKFNEYFDKKVALYGLGTETEKVLTEFCGCFEIVGLLDGYRTNGQIYGMPIISIDRAIESHVELIIVVARPGSCKAIKKRIGNICKEHEIALMDIRGKDLLVENRVSYDFRQVAGTLKVDLYQKLDKTDVVSFDLFDTLVMRKTLCSDDVLGLMNKALQEKGIYIDNFSKRRLASEKELAKYGAPVLETIYENAFKGDDLKKISASELAELEWELDFSAIIPREAVCEIFQKAVRDGKAVYVITDTYYHTSQIKHILAKCGLHGYAEVFASCEYNTGKTQKLFEKYRQKVSAETYLHIGDDIVADIDCAKRFSIDSFRIYNAMELLDEVGYLGMSTQADAFADRLKMGLFVSRLFNNPFQFETEDRQIEVSDCYNIGYLFLAPIITDFVHWFYDQVSRNDINNIWFSARDGYLVQKLYKELSRDDDSVYFLTSRTAAIRAGVENEADISYVDSMKFSGTLEENLKVRFGIDIKEGYVKQNSVLENGLLKYKKLIFSTTQENRKKYQRYIDSLQIWDGEIAFFDFVAKGTTQMYVQKLVKNHLKGLYFLQLEPEFMSDKNLDIVSFYEKEERDGSAIFDNYYILETILTAPFPSVSGFASDGKPIYADETRSGKDIECFQKVQEGIMEYFHDYLNIVPRNLRHTTKKLDEMMLQMIGSIRITDQNFLSLVVEDPFFNRMTDIKDVIGI